MYARGQPDTAVVYTGTQSPEAGASVSLTSLGTLSCFLPRPPLRTILRISSTKLSGESAYLWNKKEVPDDKHRALRPVVGAGAANDGGTAVADSGWRLLFPRAKRWSTRYRTPRAPMELQQLNCGRVPCRETTPPCSFYFTPTVSDNSVARLPDKE